LPEVKIDHLHHPTSEKSVVEMHTDVIMYIASVSNRVVVASGRLHTKCIKTSHCMINSFKNLELLFLIFTHTNNMNLKNIICCFLNLGLQEKTVSSF